MLSACAALEYVVIIGYNKIFLWSITIIQNGHRNHAANLELTGGVDGNADILSHPVP